MKQIYCPKCHTGYEIDENLIPEDGKKLRCSYCNQVFKAYCDDLIDAPVRTVAIEDDEPSAAQKSVSEETSAAEEAVSEESSKVSTEAETTETPSQTDSEMDDIFKRLSQQTEELFKAESELPPFRRFLLKCRQLIGLYSKAAFYYAGGTAALLLLLCLYSFRYEIVRGMPFMNGLYRAVGISATIPGEGLEFQNIAWDDFEEDYVRKLEVKGFIVNTTDEDIRIPLIHIEMLDKDAVLLQSLNQNPEVGLLKAGARVAIGIKIRKPSPLTKYVYLTFVESDNR